MEKVPVELLVKELKKQQEFETVSNLFALLGDATRLKIFWVLCHSSECVQNLAQALNLTMPAVSHHLRILREAGLIESYRDGKEVFYGGCNNDSVKELHDITEKLMLVSCPDFDLEHEKINEQSKYMETQVATVKKVHDYLVENLEKRITIEELSKKFAMNPTTLKTVFKDVYGMAIASHVKEHRMEKSVELLKNTSLSVAQIALQVGYESQSKFSAVFKETYGVTPMEYRKY